MRITRRHLLATTAAALLLAGGNPPLAGSDLADPGATEPAPDRPVPVRCRVTPAGTLCDHDDRGTSRRVTSWEDGSAAV